MKNLYSYITQLDEKLFRDIDKERFALGLAYGYTGLCLYLFEQYRKTGDKRYESYAGKCFQTVCEQYNQSMSIGLYNGFAGISLGINILSLMGYVNVPKRFYKDINELCFKNLTLFTHKSTDVLDNMETKELILLLDYFCFQLNQKNCAAYEIPVYKKLLIKLMDFLYTNRLNEILQPPVHYRSDEELSRFLYALYKMYQLQIDTLRINRIIADLTDFVCALVPVPVASKLQLLYVMLKINEFYSSPEWNNHIRLLHTTLSVEGLCENTFGQALYYDQGLAGSIMLLHYLNTNYPEYAIPGNQDMLWHKIAESEAWDHLLQDGEYLQKHHNLFCGYPGIVLTCYKMKWL